MWYKICFFYAWQAEFYIHKNKHSMFFASVHNGIQFHGFWIFPNDFVKSPNASSSSSCLWHESSILAFILTTVHTQVFSNTSSYTFDFQQYFLSLTSKSAFINLKSLPATFHIQATLLYASTSNWCTSASDFFCHKIEIYLYSQYTRI